jgi:hypothetical protein
MSMSIMKWNQQLLSTTEALMRARQDGDADLTEELEAELAEIEEALEAIEADNADDHRFGRM